MTLFGHNSPGLWKQLWNLNLWTNTEGLGAWWSCTSFTSSSKVFVPGLFCANRSLINLYILLPHTLSKINRPFFIRLFGVTDAICYGIMSQTLTVMFPCLIALFERTYLPENCCNFDTLFLVAPVLSITLVRKSVTQNTCSLFRSAETYNDTLQTKPTW